MGTRALYGTLLAECETELATSAARFRLSRFRNLGTGAPALALTRGDVRGSEPLLARVHSSCVTSEAFGACDCDCAGQLQAALAEIAAAGRGALFYLFQEGRGAGFAAKARDRMAVQASGERVTTFDAYAAMGLARDQRRYEEVAFLCRLLGIEARLRLLTHNPEKAKALAEAGVALDGLVPLAAQQTPWNRHYLLAKSRSGHALEDPGAAGACGAPAPLAPVAPSAFDAAGRFVRVARYQLPVLLPERAAPLWLTLHLYYDLAERCERVLLAHTARPEVAPLATVRREALADRFAPGFTGQRKPGWLAALRAFEAHGAGVALFLPPDDDRAPDAETLDLLAALAGHFAVPLTDADEPALGAAIAAAIGRAAA
ncbi:MAG TPA: GTP cyclohydrolase II [Myxococcota bacterium]|nr:GTP cyclohydrolase II [Myxococcota bacterium]